MKREDKKEKEKGKREREAHSLDSQKKPKIECDPKLFHHQLK